MKKADVQVGATYEMNHSSGRVFVRILGTKERHAWNPYGGRDLTGWRAVNLRTGREIEIKSAQKLLRLVKPAPGGDKPQAAAGSAVETAETPHGTLSVGETVGLSVEFLRSTGQHTGPIPFARGEILGMKRIGGTVLADVAWNTPEMPGRVNAANLASIRHIQLGY